MQMPTWIMFLKFLNEVELEGEEKSYEGQAPTARTVSKTLSKDVGQVLGRCYAGVAEQTELK